MTSTSSSPISIRPYHSADATQLCELDFESARALGARRYSAEQVAAWAPGPADRSVVEARANDGRLTLVAVDQQGLVLAYGDLERDGHIDHLYCRPEAAGQGIASAVLDRAAGERAAPTDRSRLRRSQRTRARAV